MVNANTHFFTVPSIDGPTIKNRRSYCSRGYWWLEDIKRLIHKCQVIASSGNTNESVAKLKNEMEESLKARRSVGVVVDPYLIYAEKSPIGSHSMLQMLEHGMKGSWMRNIQNVKRRGGNAWTSKALFISIIKLFIDR